VIPEDKLDRQLFWKLHDEFRKLWAKKGPRSALIDDCVDILSSRGTLPDVTAKAAFTEILFGDVAPDQIGALLVLLTPELLPASTIAAFARVLREHVSRVDPGLKEGEILSDTCGTGSDGFGTFNVSTTIMFILAAAGVKIAKHGNRAVTSKCGSADVLESVGVRIVLSSEAIEECIRDVGIGFMYAPEFHRVLKNLQPLREILAREMPATMQRRTIFNVLGPLANPAFADRQIVGVYSAEMVAKFAEVLRILGLQRAIVVHGQCDGFDMGLDEFSTLGKSVVAELKDGQITTWEYTPEQAGITRPNDPEVLKGRDKRYNAQILRRILSGDDVDARMDLALLNAGAGMYLADKASTIVEGIEVARRLVKSGDATAKLNRFIVKTNELGQSH
jgi:anthranilate phosphoribosyltransferase